MAKLDRFFPPTCSEKERIANEIADCEERLELLALTAEGWLERKAELERKLEEL